MKDGTGSSFSRKKILCFFLFFSILAPFSLRGGVNDGSIMLHNDTIYILTAIIQASDGSYLGQVSIQPGQQSTFATSLSSSPYVRPGTPSTSLTPYTVIWQCPSQGIYSICRNVSPGAYVRASECEGNHFCSPKQSQSKAPSSTLKKTQ